MVDLLAFEAQDEAEQIDGEREHPEKRNGRDVLAQMIGDGEQQRGSAGGQRGPQDADGPTGRRRPAGQRRMALACDCCGAARSAFQATAAQSSTNTT